MNPPPAPPWLPWHGRFLASGLARPSLGTLHNPPSRGGQGFDLPGLSGGGGSNRNSGRLPTQAAVAGAGGAPAPFSAAPGGPSSTRRASNTAQVG